MKNLLANRFRTCQGSKNMVILGLLAAALVLVILIAIIAFTLFNIMNKSSSGASELVSYFPENAVMYAELNLTSEKFKELQEISGGQLSLDKIAENIKKVANNPDESIEAMQVLNELNNTLEPVAAMGIWGINEATQTPEKAVLAVIVKDSANVDAMMERVTENETKFEVKNIDGIDFHIAQQGNGCYATVGKVLLISDKIETIQDSIQFKKNKNTNVLSNPKVKAILENLQQDRVFTLIVNAGEISNKMTPPATGSLKTDSQTMKDIANVMPFAGIGVDFHKDLLEAKFYGPYDLSNVEHEAVKKNLEKLFQASSSLNAPNVLPKNTFMFISMTGVSYLIDTSIQMLDPQAQQEFNNQKQMIKMMSGGLDVDTDILPLFSEELTIAGTISSNNEVEPVVLLTSKPESEQVLSKVASTMVQMSMDPSASVTQEAAGSVQLNLIKSPQIPFPIGFGKVGNVIALGKASTLKDVASSQGADSLAGTPDYEDMKKYMIPDVSFAMFMNIDQMLAASKIMGESGQQVKELEEMSKTVSSIMISAGNKNDKAIEGNFIMKFKPQE